MKQFAGIIKSNTLLKGYNRYKRVEAPYVFGKRLYLRLAELCQGLNALLSRPQTHSSPN